MVGGKFHLMVNTVPVRCFKQGIIDRGGNVKAVIPLNSHGSESYTIQITHSNDASCD